MTPQTCFWANYVSLAPVLFEILGKEYFFTLLSKNKSKINVDVIFMISVVKYFEYD